jgi:predicted Rdx family selenoprotein
VLKERGHEAAIAPGAKSQFDVVADGTLVFSKQQQGRFPEADEILEAVAS